jgi:hypothetical protein
LLLCVDSTVSSSSLKMSEFKDDGTFPEYVLEKNQRFDMFPNLADFPFSDLYEMKFFNL